MMLPEHEKFLNFEFETDYDKLCMVIIFWTLFFAGFYQRTREEFRRIVLILFIIYLTIHTQPV